MPIINTTPSNDSMEFKEFIEFTEENIDMNCTDSLSTLATSLKKLGNNRDFLTKSFEDLIKKNYSNINTVSVSNSLTLVSRRDFYVRANFWLPENEMTESEAKLYAYNIPHDHNFDLLSLAYCGDGYITENFEYDYSKVAGYIGEVVEIIPLGTYKPSCGDTIIYRCNKDIHTQRQPEIPSITLNVIPLVNQNSLLDQYFFDIKEKSSVQGVISNYASGIIEKRKSLLQIAKCIKNENITQIIADIASTHACNRTRYEAMHVLKNNAPLVHDQLCETLRDDKSKIIQHYVNSHVSA